MDRRKERGVEECGINGGVSRKYVDRHEKREKEVGM